MKQPDVSIIIPAYNVQDYLDDCLTSIVKQNNFDRFEVIVINDGSTDSTPDIARDYARRHDNIRLVDQENAGVSVARNRGMDMARGKFISFVDGDDCVGVTDCHCLPEHPQKMGNLTFIRDYQQTGDTIPSKYDPNYFTRMVKAATTFNAEIAMGGKITTFLDQHMVTTCIYQNTHVYKTSPIDKDILLRQANARESANFAVYRRDFMNAHNLRFAELMALDEDMLFCMQAVLHANRVVTVPESLYLYKRRMNTLSSLSSEMERIEKYTRASIQHMSVILNDLKQKPEYAASYKYWIQDFSKQSGFEDDYYSPCFPHENCTMCTRKTCGGCQHEKYNDAVIRQNLMAFNPYKSQGR